MINQKLLYYRQEALEAFHHLLLACLHVAQLPLQMFLPRMQLTNLLFQLFELRLHFESGLLISQMPWLHAVPWPRP